MLVFRRVPITELKCVRAKKKLPKRLTLVVRDPSNSPKEGERWGERVVSGCERGEREKGGPIPLKCSTTT